MDDELYVKHRLIFYHARPVGSPLRKLMAFIRPAEQSDYPNLLSFTNGMNYLHRHLDWRDTLAWLGRQPFCILEENHQIQAALACPAEPPEVAWVRLFAVSMHTSPDRAWKRMFEHSLDYYSQQPATPIVASLALREWYEDLLRRNGFHHHQDIVVFMFDQEPPPPPSLDPAFLIRPMTADDLDNVSVIDHMAFEPIWRLSNDDLLYAFHKGSYSTVVERGGQIMGYQMSSSSGMYAHLARLAVHPGLQRQRVGFGLVQNLLDYFINKLNFWGVTLNTQHNNASSLALYNKIGFQETGERFPVYVYNG